MREAEQSSESGRGARRRPARRRGPDGASLDLIDRRVIAALQAEGRRPFSSIAEELGISESVVRYRVQRLEDAGILQVVGIADPLRIGFDLMAMVGVKVRPGSVAEVCAHLEQLPETSYVATVAGRYDVLAEVVCRDTHHFQHLLTEQMHDIDGVVSTESFLILELHKMAYGWGAGEHGVPLADDDVVLAPSETPRPTRLRAPRGAGSTTSRATKKRDIR